jgi:cysteine desulfurase family protein
MEGNLIYLDNAATSWPKPESVYAAVNLVMRERCGNPGRSGHKMSLAAQQVVSEARLLAAKFFNALAPDHIIFGLNATDALNLAIHGTLKSGNHVITSAMEHNSVARPLEMLKKSGVEITKLHTDPVNGLEPGVVNAAIKSNTRLVAITHVSNVTGTVNPVADIGKICREHGVLFLVDSAQSAGVIPIDVREMNIDMLAFAGHKSLLGPQGTGGLYIGPGVDIPTLRQGGTGSQSDSLAQPETLPEKYESGTANTPGLAGLASGLRYIAEKTVEGIWAHEARLASALIDALSTIKGITIYGPPAGPHRSGVVSLTIDSLDAADAAMILDSSFDIAVRAGLHCAPDAHKTLGTFEHGGTIRVSIGCMNTEKEIECFAEAIARIATANQK